jgi:signal transduction histidine kinase
MTKPAMIAGDGPSLTLTSLSPSRLQWQIAIAVTLALAIALFLLAGELATVQLARVDAFVPIYATVVFVNDLITAVLLFNQFSIQRSRALLAIAAGYLVAGLMMIPWTLTFPGVFTPNGLLGAGLQSTNWLYVLRYGGFLSFVMAYALFRDSDPPERSVESPVGTSVLASVAISVVLVCAATIAVTAGNAALPRISIDATHFSSLTFDFAGGLIAWSALAMLLLWYRHRSVLDLWLMVVVCAYAIEIAIYLFSFPGLARFSAGWYAGRVFGFVSSSVLLFVLMHEITTLYARLFRAVLAQHREREARLMTGDAVSASIAHEVKQPLAAIIASANAGLNWLDRPEPDLDEVRETLRRVVNAGNHADAVVENIRGHFRKSAVTTTSLDINDVVREALAIVRERMQTHRIAVRTDLDDRLPRIRGEPVQLQQVLLNLITNAIDSMASKNGERVLSVRAEIHGSDGVEVSVEDTGKGLDPDADERIFNPAFTTKAHGMGMGLAICRSIIEAHEGQLWVTGSKGRGAAFRFTVPVDHGSMAPGVAGE